MWIFDSFPSIVIFVLYSVAHSAEHRHFFISLHILYVYVTIELLEYNTVYFALLVRCNISMTVYLPYTIIKLNPI